MESMWLSRVFFFFTLQFFVSFIIFTLFNKNGNTTLQNGLSAESNSTNEPSLIILLWTYPFGIVFPLNQCPPKYDASQCFFTVDRSRYLSANAVIIHHRDVCSSKNQLPQIPRPPNQYWIWFNMESPTHCPNLQFMDKLINLTMSYRVDSDIFAPYGYLEKSNGNINFTIPQKTKLVAWAVSNWNPRSRRVQYYDELKKYIKVDIYGVRHLHLSRSHHLETISMYKFYFAFENSIHVDYITEKLWVNSFASGTVPVVMGPPRENYERYIPPDSFIHVDDFLSAQDLASYLLSLDKDDEKYQQYFNWRSTYTIPEPEGEWIPQYCRVCKSLREGPTYRTIPSVAAWFK
ncbi:3-galactosyl-N-acetylglucosaminide 4-alpha-L-fucosyltransferase FUT3-like [Pyxicephalus adspersus]|uniref:Fucosyltransferase n=1 Tax=Pyxicephalus adspersus TaxID=30357 RepID=A0AAV2ZYW2_PYXAD|nr:TPA: hypothetical protein GDO54_002756 [Pyxicephalus adspersus]